MKAKGSDWYRHGWSLDIKQQSWTEDTENQVDFIMRTLRLKGNERILDLACGYGRHALSFARRGFSVVGLDITKEYVADATQTAKEEGLDATFVQADIRDACYCDEFDVVLNLADGAIGYLENDQENLKIFDIISKALKVGGKHVMDICNAKHAQRYFPRTNWEIGEKALSLAQFDWNQQADDVRRVRYCLWSAFCKAGNSGWRSDPAVFRNGNRGNFPKSKYENPKDFFGFLRNGGLSPILAADRLFRKNEGITCFCVSFAEKKRLRSAKTHCLNCKKQRCNQTKVLYREKGCAV